MESMKLVIATPLYPPEIGGPATYAKLLMEGLPAKGVAVNLVKFDDVRHLPKLVRHLAYFFRVRRALKKADAVLTLDPVSTGLPACLAAWSLDKPLIVKIVGDYAWEQGRQRFGVTASLDEFVTMKQVPMRVRFLQSVQSRVARHAQIIIVPSEYLKTIVATWGIGEEKIEVVHNAVVIEAVGAVPAAVEKLPRPLVVTAGRLVPWKHIEGVIDAIALMAGKKTSLAVVGEGPDREVLERHAAEQLPGRTVFTGLLSHADTLATIQMADVFVLNSSYEGLSHLLIEALSLGVPIITTRAGGNLKVITNDDNGLLVPVGDTSALAAALTRIFSDEALRARLVLRAVESSSHFSIDAMLARTVEIVHAHV